MQTGKAGLPLRTITTVMMALTGASLFIAFMLEDLSGLAADQSAALSRMLVLRYILAMAIGGALAGWLLAGLFGRRGLRGWFLALLDRFDPGLEELLIRLEHRCRGRCEDLPAAGRDVRHSHIFTQVRWHDDIREAAEHRDQLGDIDEGREAADRLVLAGRLDFELGHRVAEARCPCIELV